jgi:hypothetical protein
LPALQIISIIHDCLLPLISRLQYRISFPSPSKSNRFPSYIEHYANANDFVSRFSVIEFIHSLPNYPSNRFAGRLFVRPNQGGHFFVQHYLTEMFGDDQWFLDMPVVTKCILPPSRSEDPQKFGAGRMTVRDLSRLAAYLDGGSP